MVVTPWIPNWDNSQGTLAQGSPYTYEIVSLKLKIWKREM